jgi:hypothetical protein
VRSTRIVTNCLKCGKECVSRFAAMRHCQKPWPNGPYSCHICGKEHDRRRKAYVCCQQNGTQRGAGEGYVWRGYVSLDERFKARMQEIRDDPIAMAEVRILAEWLWKGQEFE